MAKRDARMVSLGYGKFVRADRVFALVPLEPGERGDGRRTYVHVDGLSEPLVASRSERAILADVEAALTEAAGVPRRRRRAGSKDQREPFLTDRIRATVANARLTSGCAVVVALALLALVAPAPGRISGPKREDRVRDLRSRGISAPSRLTSIRSTLTGPTSRDSPRIPVTIGRRRGRLRLSDRVCKLPRRAVGIFVTHQTARLDCW